MLLGIQRIATNLLCAPIGALLAARAPACPPDISSSPCSRRVAPTVLRGLILLLIVIPLYCRPVEAAELRRVRIWPSPEGTRVVFDLSSPVKYRSFSLHSPERLVLDLYRARARRKILPSHVKKGLVRRIRSAARKGNMLRLVLELRKRARARVFLLRPNRRYGHRLVVDLDAGPETTRRHRYAAGEGGILVVVDPGHGGEDPGAIGPHGTREKDVVLSLSRYLKKRIDAHPGMRAVLTRKGDYYVGLRERTRKARRMRADLFISIHANASRNRRLRGASVYVLSTRGASSRAARWLAQSENSADYIGGIPLKNKDHKLRKVLLDLSQTATMKESSALAGTVLRQLRNAGPLQKRKVQKAAFMVLMSPDIPSILVETAFISNGRDEKKLRSTRYQKRLADAIMRGVLAYLQKRPGKRYRLAVRRHRVLRGETLSGIALRYKSKIADIKRLNHLRGDTLYAGSILLIPADS